jgi:hypothetical protein
VIARELREFTLACACHLAAAVSVRVLPFRRVLALSTCRLPPAREPISLDRLTALVARSRRICRGSCLTESVVLRMLATRNGHPDLPLTIGVAVSNGALRAHAWAGEQPGSGGFTPLWPPSRNDTASEGARR